MATPLERKSSLEEIRKRFDLDLLLKVGFRHIDLLHKNFCFAAFGAIKTDYRII
jgi:hypothetical protein